MVERKPKCVYAGDYIFCVFFSPPLLDASPILTSFSKMVSKKNIVTSFFLNFQIHFTVYQKEIESSAITEKSKNRISHLLFFCCCHNCSEFQNQISFTIFIDFAQPKFIEEKFKVQLLSNSFPDLFRITMKQILRGNSSLQSNNCHIDFL